MLKKNQIKVSNPPKETKKKFKKEPVDLTSLYSEKEMQLDDTSEEEECDVGEMCLISG